MKEHAQAIILAAGTGSRMTTVGFLPKCLLPVANYPMIYYPLMFLQNSGFKDVLVVVRKGDEGKVAKLKELYDLKICLDIVPVNTSEDPGTAESLRVIEGKIKKNVEDVVILSCDMVTDAHFEPILTAHLKHGAALTMLTTSQNQDFVNPKPPGPKMKTTVNNDLICMEGESQRVVFIVAGGDYDDRVKIPSKITNSLDENLFVFSDLVDAHMYIMKRWVMDYIIEKNSPCAKLGSLKAEVIPQIIAEQFLDKDKTKLTIHKKKNSLENLIQELNTSSISSRFQRGSKSDCRVSFAFHHQGFCTRINTMGSLWQINKQAELLYNILGMPKVTSSKDNPDEINPKAQICNKSLIGRSTRISEKTNIQDSVIGRHCRIEPLVRISNSVLFDYVNIAKGCVIENSLICVNVDFKCVLKNTILADASRIEEGVTYENELLERSPDYTVED